MSNLSTTSRIALITTGVLAAATLSYAVYFDHRRRTDAAFRKQLRKQHRKYAQRQQAQADGGRAEAQEQLRRALVLIASEAVPQDVTAKEAYFMEQVGFGEQLAARSPEHFVAAAISFYRALRVYPAPTELITIYQKTQPAPVFEYVMQLVAMDIGTATAGASAASRDPRDRPSSEAILTEIDSSDNSSSSEPSTNGSGGSATGSGTGSATGSGTGSFVHVNGAGAAGTNDSGESSSSRADDPPEAAL